MNQKLIETHDLTKIYNLKGRRNALVALDNININIQEDEIFGLLGPNGAGKTTFVQLLTTLKQPTSGSATINGYDILKKPKKARENIALMLDSKMLYYRITGYANLKFFCKIYKVPYSKERVTSLAEELGIKKWLDQYVEYYSGGMMMKLALIRTLLLNRRILFLDEPTLGLDVESKSLIIQKLKVIKENHSILFTSHDMDAVEKLCDRIAFINKGKIIKIGSKEDIKKIHKHKVHLVVSVKESSKTIISELNSLDYVLESKINKGHILIVLKNRDFYSSLLNELIKYDIRKINEIEDTLEDAFLKLNANY
ncbi:MAG: ATP-binding cassette domain-containing protein [Promethearchaeota archaeon]